MSTYFHSNVNYYEYIRSDEWRAKANAAKRRVGYRCQVCNKHSNEVQLDAHHRTYERLGQEFPDDITILCRDCHTLYETNRKLTKLSSSRDKTLPAYQPQTYNSLAQEEKASPTYRPQLHRPSSKDRELPVYQPPPNHVQASATVEPNVTSKASQPSQSVMQEKIDPPTPADFGHFGDLFDPNIHLLSKLGVWIYVLGAIGQGLFIIYAEAVLLMNDPASIINPVAHYQVIVMTLTSPIFWQIMTVLFGGLALTGLGNSLVNFTQPKFSALRWFWQWKSTAFVKIPIFLIAFAHIFYSTVSVFSSILIVMSENMSILQFPLVIPILRFYVSYLPIPIVHLIWDNRFRDGWRKLVITIMYLLVWIIAIFFIEVTWSRTLCANQLNAGVSCNFFQGAFYPSNRNSDINRSSESPNFPEKANIVNLDKLLVSPNDLPDVQNLRRPDAPSSLRIVADMFNEQGNLESAIAYWDRMIIESRESADPIAEADALEIKAMMYRAQGKHKQALELYYQAYSIHKEHDDIARQASLLQKFGDTYQEIGQYPQAIDAYNQSLIVRHQVHGAQKNINTAKILYLLGMIRGNQEKYTQALYHFNLALPIAQELKEPGYEFSLHLNMGAVYMNQDLPQEALVSFQQAHAISLEIESRAAEADSLNGIGSSYLALENTLQSISHFEQALPIMREIGNYQGERVALFGLGVLHDGMGNLETAEKYLIEAIKLEEEYNLPSVEETRKWLTAIQSDISNQ